jgi:hypothetical protein
LDSFEYTCIVNPARCLTRVSQNRFSSFAGNFLPWAVSDEASFDLPGVASAHGSATQASYVDPLQFGGTGAIAAETTATPPTSIPWGYGGASVGSGMEVLFQITDQNYRYDSSASFKVAESGYYGFAAFGAGLHRLELELEPDTIYASQGSGSGTFARSGVLGPGIYEWSMGSSLLIGGNYQTSGFDLLVTANASWDATFTLTPVGAPIPEPPPFALLGAASAGFVMRLRTRRSWPGRM